jgi:hypothetical protein
MRMPTVRGGEREGGGGGEGLAGASFVFMERRLCWGGGLGERGERKRMRLTGK